MAKKLTAAELNKMSSKFNERKTIHILDGQYEVVIHTHFRDSDIDNVLMSYIEIIEEIKKGKDITNKTLKDTATLINTLILREFTNLPIPKSNNIENLIKYTYNLQDNDITLEVLNNLPKDQIEKVQNKINSIPKKMGELMSELAIQAALQPEVNEPDIEVIDNPEEVEPNGL